MDVAQGARRGAAGLARDGFPGGPGGMPGGRGGAIAFLGPYGGIVAVALLVITYVVLAIALWKFMSKAGLTPAVALLMFVPVVNLGVVLWAAFTEWPILQEVTRLKELVATRDLLRGSTPVPAGAGGGLPDTSV